MDKNYAIITFTLDGFRKTAHFVHAAIHMDVQYTTPHLKVFIERHQQKFIYFYHNNV